MTQQVDNIYHKAQDAWRRPQVRRRVKWGFVSVLIINLILFSLSALFITKPSDTVAAPTYKFKTGTYVGNGSSRSITGLGFAPEAVIIKATTADGVGAFLKTTGMNSGAVAYLGSATANTTYLIDLKTDGFDVTGTNANTANVVWTWYAFGGSDCTSGGTFCVGSYTGAGSGTKAIPTGFQPDMVLVKASTAVTPSWRSSAMPTNYAQFLTATTQDTAGAYFTTLDTTGFTVGASNNTAAMHHFIAFKQVTGSIKVGTYTGNGTSQSVTSMGFMPNLAIVKNANAATPVGAVYNVTQSNGNSSSYFTDTANVVAAVTSLDADGFSVGSHATANGSTNTIYWAAFGGAAAPSSSGTFQMASGSYTGNGEYKNINGLSFTPDLVIIKGNTTAAGVFTTKLHAGGLSSYLGYAGVDFGAAIESLGGDGFSVGTSTTVNSNGVTYHWTAYGNAWDPIDNSGASDFAIGTYYGNAVDNRNIVGLPFQPDMVTVKINYSSEAVFKTSEHVGDTTSLFSGIAGDTADYIQSLNSDGFQVGSSTAYINRGGVMHRYFAFKEGSNFTVNSYTGNGSTQNITTVGFQPENLWVRAATPVVAVQKTDTMAAANSVPFSALAEISTAFSGFLSNGFAITNAAETNTLSTNYRYMAWNKSITVAAPTYKFKTGTYVGNGSSRSITGLGFAPEAVIIKATTADGVGAFLKTTGMNSGAVAYLGSATANTTYLIDLKTDGFDVTGTNANTANVVWTWYAFGGSDCTSGGTFCVGSYTGAGSGTKAIPTGFQPDMVLVKASTAVTPSWRSSAMPTNYAQFLTATTQDTAGAYFTTLDTTGFTVGASNNTAAMHHFIAFKQVTGSIKVGTYTGNGTSQSVTSMGFMPNLAIVKNANAATPVGAVYNVTQSNGNSSSYFTDTANVVAAVTSLDADGFSVGSHATANGSTNTIYWAAFGGAAAPSSSGTFQMASGSYTGNGEYKNINGLSFTPDLVIIKGNTTAAGVFRTKLHAGDATSYLDAATTDITLAIQSLNGDGFSIGTNAVVNSNGVTYHWTAYGNAWDPISGTGSSDFMVGAYYGNGSDNRFVTALPFVPNMVTVKAVTAVAGTFRTSAHSGDLSSYFTTTAEAANLIQTLGTQDGMNMFQVGTATNVNTAATRYWYFAFKNGTNFIVNSYTGSSSNQDITSVGFQPDNLWVKAATATRGVEKTDTMAAANSAPFINVAEISTAFTGFLSNGFALVGAAAETNANGTAYKYVAWKKNVGVDATLGQGGSQISTMSIPSSDNYIGAYFTINTISSSALVTSIKVTETGTVNANSDLSNLDIYYETSGTCTYNGTETLFGTATNFTAAEAATVSGNMYVSVSQVCIYAILDIGSGSTTDETLELEISNPVTDILSNAGIVLPSSAVVLSGTTTLQVPSNTAPNSPSSMAQKKTDETVIITGGWINATSIKFTATVSDTDNPDTLYLCVEKDLLGTTFSGTEDLCGTGVGYSGTPLTATVTITGITDASEYHWQARVKDAAGAYSSWVSYDTNLESERDFGIDTTAPTGGIVKDGTTSDQDWNDGSLTEISANWTGTEPSSTASGLLKYEYAIRREIDSYYWNPSTGWQVGDYWTNNNSSTSFTVSSMNLSTGVTYYVVLKTYDNAGNIATINSNGQQVSPSLSFSIGSSVVNFSELDDLNHWTDTKTTTVTTSTNASSGYTVKAFAADYLRSLSYGTIYINAFVGTWATPQDWANYCEADSNDCGFGYTSNDTLVQGSNRFASGSNYAAYTLTSPGNVVADHTDAVNGTTGAVSNEQFTVTHKVSVSPSQDASVYQTLLYIIVTANF